MRTLSVSRGTVRKVIRSHETAFKYKREVQPTPELGEWVEVLTALALPKAAKAKKYSKWPDCTVVSQALIYGGKTFANLSNGAPIFAVHE